MTIEVTDEMIDRLMPNKDDSYPDCPLCGYDGHWNHTISGESEQRQAIRELLEKALSS